MSDKIGIIGKTPIAHMIAEQLANMQENANGQLEYIDRGGVIQDAIDKKIYITSTIADMEIPTNISVPKKAVHNNQKSRISAKKKNSKRKTAKASRKNNR